jgi:hypothetical protein
MESSLISILMLLIGLAVGAAAVWLALRAKSDQVYKSAKAEDAAQAASLQERLAARDLELQKLQKVWDREVSERDDLRETNSHLKAELEGERRAAQERKDSFKQAAEELSEKFIALYRVAVKDNFQSFV